MSWHGGANNFQAKVILSQPLFFNTGPKLQRITGDSLEFYSGSNQAYKAMTLQGADGHVITHVALHNYSDATIKSDVVPASSTIALEVLKAIQAKTYKRTDLADESTRIGFIAQDVAAVLPPEWSNIVGKTEAVAAHTDDDGNEAPAQPSKLTLDYSRLVCCLWEANRNMLARIEALEAAAAS